MNIFLRRARSQAGLTQGELANAINTSLTSIWRWERGTLPSSFYRAALCDFFHLSPAELGWPGSEKKTQRRTSQTASRPLSLIDPSLPPLSYPFLGRREVLADLQEQLCLPDHVRLLGLTGLPGSGKTAVMQALALSADVQEEFVGILWVQIGQKSHPEYHLQRWAHLLGLGTLPSDLSEAQDTLRAVIGQRRMLFLLDDVWTPEGAAPYLRIGGKACRYLLTTRQPGLAYLLCQSVIRLSDLEQDEAFTLLTADLPSAIVEEYRDTLTALATRVGCHPLALAWMRDLLRKDASIHPPRRLRKTIARLADRVWYLALSHTLPISSSGRAGSFFSTFQQSEVLLAPATRQVFHILAQAFQEAPFTESDAIALLRPHHILQDLDNLMDAGFLEWSEQEQGRYHFHPILAAYARLVSEKQQENEAVDPCLLSFALDASASTGARP
jgi:transcriptional regulator with XRE-family HTH domain